MKIATKATPTPTAFGGELVLIAHGRRCELLRMGLFHPEVVSAFIIRIIANGGQLFQQFRQGRLHGAPDDTKVDVEIAVGDAISHPRMLRHGMVECASANSL